MSILSSSGLGAERVHFNTLYERRDKFIEAYNDARQVYWWVSWNSVDVYNEEEYRFLNNYIKEFGCEDADFKSIITSMCVWMDNEWENSTSSTTASITFREPVIFKEPITKYQQKQSRVHGGRRPAKFF